MSAGNVTMKRRADDWQKPDAPTMTADQLGIVLNDIALMAKHIDRLNALMMANLAVGQDDEETYLTAIESMAQRIGWAADMAAHRVEGTGGPVRGGAKQWMMPPSFHRHQAKAEGVAA